jgi:hypothetical protein
MPSLFKPLPKSAMGSFGYSAQPYQGKRAHDRHDGRADHAPIRPEFENSENPAADKAAENSEKNIEGYAIAARFHHLASKPACYRSSYDPCEKFHSWLRWPLPEKQTQAMYT